MDRINNKLELLYSDISEEIFHPVHPTILLFFTEGVVLGMLRASIFRLVHVPISNS